MLNEAIKLAIANGFVLVTHECYDPIKEEPRNFATPDNILLDPEFWKCLGVALGWNKKYCPCGIELEVRYENKFAGWRNSHEEDMISIDEWEYHWFSFLRWIIEKKNVDEFFQELIKNK